MVYSDDIITSSSIYEILERELEEMTDDVLSSDEEEPLPEESQAMYLNDTVDTFLLSRHTPLLARKEKELEKVRCCSTKASSWHLSKAGKPPTILSAISWHIITGP